MIQHNFNPGARNCNANGAATNSHGNSTPRQVSSPPSPYLEARLLNLEVAHGDLRGEVDNLKDLYYDLYNSFGKVTRDVTPMHANSPNGTDLTKSLQSAMQFKQELEQLSREVRESVNGDANHQKANSGSTSKANGNVPPHVRAASGASNASKKSMPPHLRGGKQLGGAGGDVAPKLTLDTTKHKHAPLVTDGPVDTITRQPPAPAATLSPPPSPTTTLQDDIPLEGMEAMSLNDWKPYYLSTLKALPASVRAKIPVQQKMTTFHIDFLNNHLGGFSWSPGLKYITHFNSVAQVLRNRTYYMIDPTHEPYLPKAPGEHGAKLTTFFNTAPEEEFENLPEGTNSYIDVPMFVQLPSGRYAYFGNYSQTRWSDKLDIDTMKARVPADVKVYVAKELTAPDREPWVTQELKKHFFPKPEYEGAIALPTSDDTSILTVDEEAHNKQVASDIKHYIQDLVDWERETNIKVAMIKPETILIAFDAADADDPPALRLWWEYLECVDWNAGFYNMLVGLQAREAEAYLK
ncbi:hypothetical protein E8E12_005425 [Didymella heteroderae]|uniref:DUF6697 domain-containing protein n=1 Tax=Didymella heteroderae TaxID=1769908 RepID=A0A9P4WP20_9PLEO|nr:hypothetical protein E8E12_005425 [Didymella heteroderae]